MNGSMPHALGDTGGPVVAGLQCAEPGRSHPRRAAGRPLRDRGVRHQWADLGRAGELHLDAHGDARRPRGRARRPRDRASWPAASSSPRGRSGRADGALLFSSPNTNSIYRLDPELERVTLFRPKSGYTGVDIGRYLQPGSNGLTFDPARPPRHVPARQPPHPAGEPARRHDRDRGLVRGPAPQQPERPGLPLGRQRLVHRPALRAARHGRRPGPRARLQRRLPRVARRGDRPDRRLARGAQRNRVLTRRAHAVRGQLGPGREGRRAIRAVGGRRRPRPHRSCST